MICIARLQSGIAIPAAAAGPTQRKRIQDLGRGNRRPSGKTAKGEVAPVNFKVFNATISVNAFMLVVSLLGCIGSASSPAMGNEVELTSKNYQAWKKHIQPSPDELVWQQIDWQPDLQSGIEQAAESGRPILLWTMNGHPFGCT